MKKLLIVLVVLISLGLFAATEISLNPKADGSVTGKVRFDKDGKETSLNLYLNWISWGFSLPHENVSLTIDLDEGDSVTVSKLAVENDHLGLTWYSSQAFSGNDSLGWFNYLDDGVWGPLMVMNLKDIGLELGTQDDTDDKVALKATNILDMITVVAQAKFNVYTFVSAAGELYVTPIENLNLKAGYEYDSNKYFAGADYTMTVADLVTLN
ncbi:MAG: hypothetical protein ACP5D6_06215, partial [Kosmotogaceae bacterium]